MNAFSGSRARWRRRRALAVGLALAAIAAIGVSAGCSSTLGYYAQSVNGHLALVESARPVDEWIADPATPPALKARLELAQRIRDFAVAELKEPDNQSYRRYADLHRPAAVWNVVAAPQLSLTLQTWCFPIVGCVGYRGYYDRADADAFAATLEAQGLEVSVYGVPAYSTLGKLPGGRLADPLLSTFIDEPEGELARLVFHELAHQIVYAPGDTAFNEAFATAVERIGGARWLDEHADPAARAQSALGASRRADFDALVRRTRAELAAIYASPRPDPDKRAAKADAMARLRVDYATLKADRWGGYAGYDRWFGRANNASFGVLAAYDDLVPNFERLFEREGRDFPRFYAAAARIAELPPAERRAALP